MLCGFCWQHDEYNEGSEGSDLHALLLAKAPLCGGLFTISNECARRHPILSGVNACGVFLVNPSTVIAPAQNRSPQQTACN